MIYLFCLLATVGLYVLNKPLYRRFPRMWLHPIVLTPALLVAVLLLADIPFAEYAADTQVLLWFLGPAMVAFAVPIYQHRRLIREFWAGLALGTLAGVATGLSTSWVLARAFHFSPEVMHSLLVRSVSTPFAMATADEVGGNADLIAMFVMVTGLAGVALGEIVLAVLPRRATLARGASYGAAAHALGTARARELDAQSGVMASLLMIFSGLTMVLLAPLIGRFVG